MLVDVSTGQNARRERMRRYLRDEGFGYLQNSVWISPDPLAQEREILGGEKINATEREAWLDAVPNDPLPGRILPSVYLGNRRGGGGWKFCAMPTGNRARSTRKKTGAGRARFAV